MKIFKDKHILQKEILKTKGISFVPTMGGLHKGHISLIKQSKKSKFKTLVSIFVNPKQFNKKSDYRSYPRNTKKDLKRLKNLLDIFYLVNIMFYIVTNIRRFFSNYHEFFEFLHMLFCLFSFKNY